MSGSTSEPEASPSPFPVIAWGASIAIVEAALVLVVPRLSKMFKETGLTLPLPTAVIVETSDFVASVPGIMLSSLVLLVGVVVLVRPLPKKARAVAYATGVIRANERKHEGFEAAWDVPVDGEPKLKIVARTPRRDPRPIQWGLLIGWTASFLAVWATLLFVVPDFARMFRETGMSLPDLTECVVALGKFARTSIGIVVAVTFLVTSNALLARRKIGRSLERTLSAVPVVAIALVAVIAFALFLPLSTNMLGQKL